MTVLSYIINIGYIIYLLIFMYLKILINIYINNYFNIMKSICQNILTIYINSFNLLFLTIEEDEEEEINNFSVLLLKIYKLKKEINELKSINNNNICSICCENKINICCNPCGHLYCNNCIIKSNSCYICRKNIITTIKIYI